MIQDSGVKVFTLVPHEICGNSLPSRVNRIHNQDPSQYP